MVLPTWGRDHSYPVPFPRAVGVLVPALPTSMPVARSQDEEQRCENSKARLGRRGCMVLRGQRASKQAAAEKPGREGGERRRMHVTEAVSLLRVIYCSGLLF